jgi:predicted extracellular nuclease
MPKIIINEFYRGGSLTATDEFIELLVLEDLTATQLDSFFVGDSTGTKTSKFSAYDFTNTGSITSVFKAGTIITVGGTTALTQDTSYNPAGGDWNIALNAGGAFLPNANSGNNGDIAGDDVVWVDTINTGATISADGFAADIGTLATGAFTAAANVNFGTSTNNTGYALNSDLAGASNTANWTTGLAVAATTPGQANGGANTTYINSLRTVIPPSGPTVTIAASPASITEGSTTAGLFTLTRTGDTTNALTVNFTTGGTATSGSDYLTPASFATNSIEIPAGQSSVSLAISAIDDNDVEVVENVSVTLSASANYTVGSTNAATVTINDNDAPAVTLISQIQGSGTAATAGTFTIEGIVVGDFQNAGQLGGFYLQEETTDADGSVLTSEGIFVNSLFAVNVGEKVRLTGAVQENASAPSFNQAVITPGSTGIQVTGTGLQSLVTPTVVDLPTVALGDLERYEGMLVTFPETLTVTETFNLGRFGEVVLSANGRLFQPTNFVDPNDSPASGTNASGSSNVAAVTAQQNLNDRSRIILDDGSGNSNLSDVPYINTTDANPLNDTLRLGSTTTGLTGVLGFGFSTYRIQPTQTPTFDYAARPGVPTVGGNAKVASFNVLNYFNGDGQGGGFPTARGADTLVEFNRQRAKIIAAINELNADVVGLIEIENDGDGPNSAIADLVNGLNAVAGAGTYAFVPLANTTGNAGTDAIKVAFIYKPGAVTPVGNATYFNDSAFDTARPPLAQTFQVNATGGTFTPVINHFKSRVRQRTYPVTPIRAMVRAYPTRLAKPRQPHCSTLFPKCRRHPATAM